MSVVSLLFMCSYMLQIAWALNKGVKQEYKQFWDVDLGVTYIPWEKVKLDDLDGFAEGGIIDQETVNDGKEMAPFCLHSRAHRHSMAPFVALSPHKRQWM